MTNTTPNGMMRTKSHRIDHRMQPTEGLSTAAIISVTVAGFSGIVAVFGGGLLHEWPRIDRFRLQLLLVFSLSPLALSLLGLLLESTHLPQSTVWCSSSAVAAVLFLTAGIWNLQQFVRFSSTELRNAGASRVVFSVTATLGFATCILQIYNLVALREFWPFMVALVVPLLGSTWQFSRLVLNRPARQANTAARDDIDAG
ncbi:MAG: hypothetical protein ACREVO_07600 [Steroidobacteraceae bacterium]